MENIGGESNCMKKGNIWSNEEEKGKNVNYFCKQKLWTIFQAKNSTQIGYPWDPKTKI